MDAVQYFEGRVEMSGVEDTSSSNTQLNPRGIQHDLCELPIIFCLKATSHEMELTPQLPHGRARTYVGVRSQETPLCMLGEE